MGLSKIYGVATMNFTYSLYFYDRSFTQIVQKLLFYTDHFNVVFKCALEDTKMTAESCPAIFFNPINCR